MSWPVIWRSNNLTASNLAFQQSFNACNLNYTALPCTKYVTASQDGLPQSLRNSYKGNFQPRVSVAYRPFNDTKTVVRAGFGIYTMTNLGPLSFNNSGNPTSNLHTYSNANVTDGSGTHPLIQFPQTAPPTVGVQYGGGGLDQGVDPNYRDPQANQWSVTVERQVERFDVAARELCGDAYVPVERDGGSEPDCGEHDSVCDDGGESVCRSAGGVSELDDALQHVQCGEGEL